MTIKIASFAIFIIILFMVPSAYAYDFRDEEIWVYQGSFDVGVGERADTGSYVIKIHEVNMEGTPPSAVLLVYKNKVYKDSFFVDATVNNEQVYDEEFRIHVLDIVDGKVSFEMYMHDYERVWILDVPKTTLITGEELNYGDYTFTVSGFGEDCVTLVMSNNGTVTENNYTTGDYRKIFDEILFRVVYINKEKKEAFVEIYRQGRPDLELEIISDPDIYNPNEMIEYDVVVKNNGTVPVRGIVLTASVSDGTVDQSVQNYYMIDTSEEYTFVVIVTPPVTPLGTNFTLKADVTGYDFGGRSYANSTSKETRVTSYMAIEKRLEPGEISLNRMIYGMQEALLVTLSVHNMADFQNIVNVHDELPDSFIPLDVGSLEWPLVIDADSTGEITYKAVPTKTGNFTLCPATMEWEQDLETYYALSSDDGKVCVHGAKIVAEKSLSSNVIGTKEDVDVTIIVTNEGDRDAEINILDRVPIGIRIIGGVDHWSGNLAAGSSKNIIYTIQTEKEGEFSLPEVKVSFVDVDKIEGSSLSNSVRLYVTEKAIQSGAEIAVMTETVTETGADTETIVSTDITSTAELTRWGVAGFMLSSFATLLCILTIAPVTAYLLISRVYL
ncbi:MAG: hypothetical protein JXA98_08165 [Methanosarcinaceae archaeon]|nr:hypothetical protein [Methanosarcinaceae archaeon]